MKQGPRCPILELRSWHCIPFASRILGPIISGPLPRACLQAWEMECMVTLCVGVDMETTRLRRWRLEAGGSTPITISTQTQRINGMTSKDRHSQETMSRLIWRVEHCQQSLHCGFSDWCRCLSKPLDWTDYLVCRYPHSNSKFYWVQAHRQRFAR
jgi:hypothetical protein